MQIVKILVFCMAALCSSFVSAEDLVHERVYKNGLKALVREDHRAPIAYVQIWYKVGAAYEPYGLTGLSHMLEHMMFKGTETHPQGEFHKLLSASGADENAFTSRDYTAYHQVVSLPKLDLVLELEADRMQNLFLDKQLFEKERNVVKEERRTRTEDVPEMLAYEQFSLLANRGTPYEHPVIGWMNDIDRYTVEDVKRWYETYYTPNNAVVIVVGDVKAEDVFRMIAKHFESIPKREIPFFKSPASIPSLGEIRVNYSVPGVIVPTLMIGYKAPSLTFKRNELDAVTLDVISTLLSSGESSRFSKELIKKTETASTIYSSYSPIQLFNGQFFLVGNPSERVTMTDLEKSIDVTLEKIKNGDVKESELMKAKRMALSQRIFALDSMLHQAFELGALESLGLGFDYSETYYDILQAVTLEDIVRVSKKYFVSDNKVVLTVSVSRDSQSEEERS